MMSDSDKQAGNLPLKRPRSVSPEPSSSSSEVIYFSVLFTQGPISQSLYSLTLPYGGGGGGGTKVSFLRPHREPAGDSNLYPILEIAKGHYADSMVCVKLESRFYFLGGFSAGRDGRLFPDCPSNVYFIDLETLSAGAVGDDSTPPLTEGIPMACGKPNCYAFEAHGKIYALASSHPVDRYNHHRFEVFDPTEGKWSTLPRPPFQPLVTSHACIDNTIMLCTEYDGVFFFDTNQSAWANVRSQTCFSPIGPTLFVEGSLYYNEAGEIASCGPILEDLTDSKLSQLINNQSYASSAVSDHINMRYHSHILYLGDNKFCYLMGGDLPDPKDPHNEYAGDPDQGDLRLIVFEVTGEKLYEDNGERLVFGTKLLHTPRYIRRSKRGADAFQSMVSECFLAKI